MTVLAELPVVAGCDYVFKMRKTSLSTSAGESRDRGFYRYIPVCLTGNGGFHKVILSGSKIRGGVAKVIANTSHKKKNVCNYGRGTTHAGSSALQWNRLE
jgi:hypothetical protein